MKNDYPIRNAKNAAVGLFLGSLPNPEIYCQISDYALSNKLAAVGFFKEQHEEIKSALGPEHWKRVINFEHTHFDWVRVMRGVEVALMDAEPLSAAPTSGTEVPLGVFTGREASIELGAGAVQEVEA